MTNEEVLCELREMLNDITKTWDDITYTQKRMKCKKFDLSTWTKLETLKHCIKHYENLTRGEYIGGDDGIS